MMVNGGELDGKRCLSKKTVEFMLSEHTVGMAGSTIATTGPGYGMGLGFGVRLHDGMAWVPGSKGDAMWAGAWGTSFWIDPKERLVGILMAQGPSTRAAYLAESQRELRLRSSRMATESIARSGDSAARRSVRICWKRA